MYKTTAYIQSLNRGLSKPTYTDEITVLQDLGNNEYVVEYKGIKCHAIFNWFVGAFFADDVYAVTE